MKKEMTTLTKRVDQQPELLSGQKEIRTFVFVLLTLLWIIIWFCHLTGAVYKYSSFYRKALSGSLENLHDFYSWVGEESKDYYSILKFCNDFLPQGKTVQVLLPTDSWRRYAYLREKGRYFLYPRNFGNNSLPGDYILVYGVKDFLAPTGYRILRHFGEDKYLLERFFAF